MTQLAEQVKLGAELTNWWVANLPAMGPEVEVVLQFRTGECLTFGTLNLQHQRLLTAPRFRLEPQSLQDHVTETTETGEKPELPKQAQKLKQAAEANEAKLNKRELTTLPDLLGLAVTRAGWLRPQVDPEAFAKLAKFKRDLLAGERSHRFDFICDTSALSNGAAQWLADLFLGSADFYVTDITYRELHDQAAASTNEDFWSAIRRRQSYYAARRFLEFPGNSQSRVRELTNDETALMLSRGVSASHKKSNEADTLILRTARRAIRESPSNIHTFFVTADTHMARRAALEIPAHALIATDAPKCPPGRLLVPCQWWPDTDQGSIGFHATVPRLIWELLALSDSVTLRERPYKREWQFCSYRDKMWPSDYRQPWILITSPRRGESSGDPMTPVVRPTAISSGAELKPPESRSEKFRTVAATEPFESTMFVEDTSPVRVQFSWQKLLDLLQSLAQGSLELPESLRRVNVDTLNSYLKAVSALNLATADRQKLTGFGVSHEEFRLQWSAGNLHYVHQTLCRLESYAEMVRNPNPPKLTEPLRCARLLGVQLGYIHQADGQFSRGVEAPSAAEVNTALVGYLTEQDTNAASMHRILHDVFLRDLGVTPVRVHRAWNSLRRAGAFRGTDQRQGGSHDRKLEVEAVQIEEGHWVAKRFRLDEVEGCRDLTLEGSLEQL